MRLQIIIGILLIAVCLAVGSLVANGCDFNPERCVAVAEDGL